MPYFLTLYLFWIDLKLNPGFLSRGGDTDSAESSVLFWGFSEFLRGIKLKSFLVSPVYPNLIHAFTACHLKKPPDYVSLTQL